MITRKPVAVFRALLLSAVAITLPAAAGDMPIAPGPFQPTMESLKQYQCPEWFRDAKFGIWAHWGPQAVPMDGDWYARHMYEQGSAQYKDHLEPLRPPLDQRLQGHHPALEGREVGPGPADGALQEGRRALLREHGLPPRQLRPLELDAPPLERGEDGPEARRGGRLAEGGAEATACGSASPSTWAPASPGSRTATAPTRPVRWPACPTTAPIRSTRTSITSPPRRTTRAGTATTRAGTRSGSAHQGPGRQLPSRPALHRRRRAVRQRGRPEHDRPSLQRQRRPQRRQARRRLHLQAEDSEGRWVEDLERGVMATADPDPWQTDTSIGDWFYNRNWKFRPVSWVIHMLVDIVSKNGNLLLNVVQRPDGILDPEVEQMLAQTGRLERHQRRGDLRHPALAGLRRGHGPRTRAATSTKTSLTPPGTSASRPRAPPSTPSPWAGPRTANSLSSRSPRPPTGKATGSSALSCSAIKEH